MVRDEDRAYQHYKECGAGVEQVWRKCGGSVELLWKDCRGFSDFLTFRLWMFGCSDFQMFVLSDVWKCFIKPFCSTQRIKY